MLHICQAAKGFLIYCKWNKQCFAQITITDSVYSQEVNIKKKAQQLVTVCQCR